LFVAVFLFCGTTHAGVIQYIDLRGNGGDLGHSATFSGADGLELYVSGFTADPTTPDDIRQKASGLGTELGVNDVSNDDPNFGAQLLSFSTNMGKIVGVEIEGFGRAEEVAFYASITNEPPALNSVLYELLFSSDGLMGNPDLFAIPDFSQSFLHVVSLTGVKATELRVSAIQVMVPEPGALSLLLGGMLILVVFSAGSKFRSATLRPR
jgi:hypothetical protein